MSKKDSLTEIVAKTLLEFISSQGLNWSQIYFRYYSAKPGHSSIQFMFRDGRELSPLRGDDKYDDSLLKQMTGLFDEIGKETAQRPLIAVISVDTEKNYHLQLDYHDPRAYEIGYLGLGKTSTYFKNNEVNIPDVVSEYQNELAATGTIETPIFF